MSDEAPLEVVRIATPLGREHEVGMVAPRYAIARTKGQRMNVPVYDDRCIPYIAGCIKERPQKKFDCLILITGPRRCGKSTLAQQLATCVDPNFNCDHIAFYLEDFNEIIKDNPQANPAKGLYPQVILDEAGFDLFSQNWMQRVQKNLVRKFEVIGSRNQIVYLVLPHRMLLNKSLREGMVHYWINVTTWNEERGFAELRIGKENLWQMEMFWKPLCAFTFNEVGDSLWKQYTTKKEKFIDDVTSERGVEGENRVSTLLKQRDECIRLAYRRGTTTMQDIAKQLGMSDSAIGNIINEGR